MNENDPIVRTAVFGEQVRQFLESDIGEYLIQMAENEVDQAMRELKSVAPWRTRRVRDLQNQIYRAESFQSWLAEAVMAGQQAMQLIEDDHGG